jgi:hypothetical protein
MDSSEMDAASTKHQEASISELFNAIKKLRSDGIQNPDLHIPKPLLTVLGLNPGSPFARHQVSKALLSCAARLEENTRSAFLFAAGFCKDITGSPGERVNRAATVLNMGRRTLYRHIEKAAHEITHLLLAGDHTPALENIDFITTSTHCRLDLRDDSPTVLMNRTVMALRDGFNALDEHLFLPLLRDPELRYYALEGCRLAGLQENGGSWTVQLRLPRCLNVGESHTFSVSVRLPDHDCLEPVFGFAPVTSMHAARIELHFETRLPSLVERIDRTWPAQMMSPTASGHPVEVMGNRAVANFRNMQPGWSYGIRWAW